MRTLTLSIPAHEAYWQLYVPQKSPMLGKNISKLQGKFGIRIKVYNSTRRCWSRTIIAGEPIILVGHSRTLLLFQNELFKFVPKS